MGMMIFATLVFLSHYRDIPFKRSFSNIFHSSIYIIVFVVVSYFVFGDYGNDYLNFNNFQIAFFIMYIITAFVFTYRMIIFNNVMFLVSMAVLYLPYIPQEDFINEIVLLSLYLMVLSSIANLVKNILYERNENYNDLDHARENLEKLILSTNDLFLISINTDSIGDLKNSIFCFTLIFDNIVRSPW